MQWAPDGGDSPKAFLVTVAVASRFQELEREPQWKAWEAAIDAWRYGINPTYSAFCPVGHRGTVCEMRILAPKPQLRLIGGFVDHETFICVAAYIRNEVAFRHSPDAGRIPWRCVSNSGKNALKSLLAGLEPMKWQEVQNAEIAEL